MDNVRILLKAMIIKEGKILALKRPADCYSRPNCWDLPGGNLEFGEDPNECVKREIKEETGLVIEGLRPICVSSILDKEKNVFWVHVGYRCELVEGEVILSKEHCEFRWVSKEEFLELESAGYLMEFVRGL